MDNLTGLPWGQLIDDEGILVGVQIDDNGLGARLLTVRAIVPAAQVDRLLARAAQRPGFTPGVNESRDGPEVGDTVRGAGELGGAWRDLRDRALRAARALAEQAPAADEQLAPPCACTTCTAMRARVAAERARSESVLLGFPMAGCTCGGRTAARRANAIRGTPERTYTLEALQATCAELAGAPVVWTGAAATPASPPPELVVVPSDQVDLAADDDRAAWIARLQERLYDAEQAAAPLVEREALQAQLAALKASVP